MTIEVPPISFELAKILQDTIKAWPSLYQTGGDVVAKILFSPSASHEWIDGELILNEFCDGCERQTNLDSLDSFLESVNGYISDETDVKMYKKKYSELKLIQKKAFFRAGLPYLTCGFYSPIHSESPYNTAPEYVNDVWQNALEVATWIIQSYPDYYEHEEIKRYKLLSESLEKLSREMGGRYMKLAQDAIAQNNPGLFQNLISRCPDNLTRVFMIDLAKNNSNWVTSGNWIFPLDK